MSDPRNSGNGLSDDATWLVLIGLLVLSTGAVNLGIFFHPATQWLLNHGVLVSGDAAVLAWGSPPVGLDAARIVLAIAILVIAVLAVAGTAVSATRRRKSRGNV